MYWPGAHHDRLATFVNQLRAAAPSPRR
ncbi:MAG: hypothetical protein M3R09_09740 [Actinomycetota bacterium]|nr:hypothetical protein [Actinomycetota bacterium]